MPFVMTLTRKRFGPFPVLPRSVAERISTRATAATAPATTLSRRSRSARRAATLTLSRRGTSTRRLSLLRKTADVRDRHIHAAGHDDRAKTNGQR